MDLFEAIAEHSPEIHNPAGYIGPDPSFPSSEYDNDIKKIINRNYRPHALLRPKNYYSEKYTPLGEMHQWMYSTVSPILIAVVILLIFIYLVVVTIRNSARISILESIMSMGHSRQLKFLD